MATFSKEFLTGGSGDGQMIKIAATATPGTLIHTCAGKDEIWLWITNTSASAANLTVEWGGAADPDDHLVKTLSIPALTKYLIAEGLILANTLVVRAFAGTANVLNASGFVHRIG